MDYDGGGGGVASRQPPSCSSHGALGAKYGRPLCDQLAADHEAG